MLNKDSFIKFMHLAASVRDKSPTAQLIEKLE